MNEMVSREPPITDKNQHAIRMERVFFILGAMTAFVGVAAGAFGAHGLKSQISAEMLSVFEVGVRYQMYHAFALIAAAWVQAQWPSAIVTSGRWFFVAGIFLLPNFTPSHPNRFIEIPVSFPDATAAGIPS